MSAVVVSFVLGSLSMAQAAGTASQPAAANPDSHALSRLFADYWQFRLRRDPERATYLGDHRYDDQLYDYSPQARELEQKLYEAWRGRLARINRSRLSESEALSADLFERTVNDFIELSPFGEHLMPIRQQDSPQIALGMLHVTHPFRTAKDCNNYVVRLRRFDKQVYDLIKLMDEGLAKGLVRPKVTIEAALKQIEGMIVEDPTASILYEPAKSLTGEAGGEESRKLIEQGTRTATRALRRLRDYLNDTYLSRCRQNVGYCFLPNGKAWYVRLARLHTTTDLTPEAMHQLGLDELKRIHAEMEEIMREVGFKGDVQAFIAHIRSDPAQHNKTAEEIMRRHAEILKRSDALLPKLFGRLPATPYGLKEIEAFRAEAAPEAYYYDAPDDGSRSAYFYVNVSQATTRPIYTMEALAYHEAQPGHHLQIALARENSSLPTFRRYDGVTAFVEGWALYSERLGKDLGGYRDPYSTDVRHLAIRPPGRRHRHALHGLDARAGLRLHEEEHRPQRAEHRLGGRPLHRLAGAGAGL
jgi:uncharacterized protein (DUF885 family)